MYLKITCNVKCFSYIAPCIVYPQSKKHVLYKLISIYVIMHFVLFYVYDTLKTGKCDYCVQKVACICLRDLLLFGDPPAQDKIHMVFPSSRFNKETTALLQCMPPSLNKFLLCLHTLDDRVWAGITRKLTAMRNALDASHSVNSRSGIVTYTVIKKAYCKWFWLYDEDYMSSFL